MKMTENNNVKKNLRNGENGGDRCAKTWGHLRKQDMLGPC